MASTTIASPVPGPIELARTAAAAIPHDISKSPLLGILGVIIGAGVVTLTGRMISLGLADLKGNVGISYDDGAWISSGYNIALVFVGPFTVYEAQAAQADLILQFCKQSLNFLALPLCAGKLWCIRQLPCSLSYRLMNVNGEILVSSSRALCFL